MTDAAGEARPAPEAARAAARPAKAAGDALADAVARVMEGRYEAAARELAALIAPLEASGDRRRAAEATFWLGFCREKQSRVDEAAELYGRVRSAYPLQPAARQAEQRRAKLPAPE
jgi:TolA-binding protein